MIDGELIIDSFAGGGKGKRLFKQTKHGLSYTPEYRAWQCARNRCASPASPAFAGYGGRGIRMCAQWLNDPAAFIADVGRRPSPEHELDRIDNEGNYEPGNCRWVLRKVNDRNRRSSRILEFNGAKRSLAEWCELLGLPRDTVRKRLEAGWSVTLALSSCVRGKRPNGAGRQDGRKS